MTQHIFGKHNFVLYNNSVNSLFKFCSGDRHLHSWSQTGVALDYLYLPLSFTMFYEKKKAELYDLRLLNYLVLFVTFGNYWWVSIDYIIAKKRKEKERDRQFCFFFTY